MIRNTALLLATIAIQAAAAQSQPGSVSGAVYPQWFIRMPAGPAITAAGVAPRYATDSSSIIEATERAREALELSMRSLVAVESATEAYAGQRAFQGENYQETALAAIGVRMVVLDTAFLENLVIVVVAASAVPVDKDLVSMPLSAPDWVGSPPRATGGESVALGSAPLYLYEHNSWVEAEARARRAAAFDATTRLRTLERSHNGDYSAVTVSSTRAVLEGARVIGRWRNDRMVYVLMRVESATRAPAIDSP